MVSHLFSPLSATSFCIVFYSQCYCWIGVCGLREPDSHKVNKACRQASLVLYLRLSAFGVGRDVRTCLVTLVMDIRDLGEGRTNAWGRDLVTPECTLLSVFLHGLLPS